MRAPLWLALLFLAACGGPEPNLKSQDPYERFLGERELIGRTDSVAIQELVSRLEDPHYLVVIGAIEVLASQGRPEFLQHFVPKLKHKHLMVRQSACAAIASVRAEEGVPALIETFKDSEPSVRRSVLKALAQFPKNPAGLRAIVEAVGDKEPSVSYLAHRLLSGITGRTDVPQSVKAWAESVK
jgi:HEAT repeat protein